MEWTMPRPVLHWVAGFLAVAALGSFIMGIVNAPERGGRLPGERVPGANAAAGASVINATDATPLAQERIESAPKPAPKASNTDETDEADTEPSATNVTPPAKATNATPAPALQTAAPPSATPATPPEDEPPH